MNIETDASATIDGSLTTWEGSRRLQLRRWADLPLENIVAALEEMAEMNDVLHPMQSPLVPRSE